MCGRFVVTPDPETLAGLYGVDDILTDRLGPSYNVAPTDRIYGVAEHATRRQLGAFRWGFIPSWTRQPRPPSHINARAETIVSKPLFRTSLSTRRCLIPADGFYEWTNEGGRKQPHFISRSDGEMLTFAGIWSVWHDPAAPQRVSTASIITTAAAGPVAELHDRMPVILRREAWNDWLDRTLTDVDHAADLLHQTIDVDGLGHRSVSRVVNSVANNSPECLVPAGG